MVNLLEIDLGSQFYEMFLADFNFSVDILQKGFLGDLDLTQCIVISVVFYEKTSMFTLILELKMTELNFLLKEFIATGILSEEVGEEQFASRNIKYLIGEFVRITHNVSGRIASRFNLTCSRPLVSTFNSSSHLKIDSREIYCQELCHGEFRPGLYSFAMPL